MPKGNTYWMKRKKHGKGKLFETPSLLWEAACEYFEWCDNNPWHINEILKSGSEAGTIIGKPISRPYTYSGLCLFLDCSTGYFHQVRKRAGKSDDTELLAVLDAIKNAIQTQQFEGTAVGIFKYQLMGHVIRRERHNMKDDDNTEININIVTCDSPPLLSDEDDTDESDDMYI